MFYSKHLAAGETVALYNEKERLIVGYAEVIGTELGRLDEMCQKHGAGNHTQLKLDPTTAADNLRQILSKFYGPHIALPQKKTTVVHLRRIWQSN